jgi:Lrp/AsnC family transcriptional regulator for asnA, asnC and gidA
MRLDDVDEAILRELQVDGRASFRQIGRTVGVSEGTVRARVRRLEGAGALRILAFVDPSRLGGSVLALMLMTVEPARERDVVAELRNWDEVTYISSLVGRFDLYAQLLCPDNGALWDVVRRVRAVPGVLATETMYETEVHKFAYRDVAARRP